MVALTGSGLGVSGAVIAEILPVLILAPLAGSVVGRSARVAVMVRADLARVLLAAVLVVWRDSTLIAYAVAFGLSAGQVFFSPAAQSVLPTVVEDDELVAANSGIWTAAVTAQILMAPVAAVVAVRFGFGVAFAVNAVSFVLSAAVLRGLREPERPARIQVCSSLAQAREVLGVLGQIRGNSWAGRPECGVAGEPRWLARARLSAGCATSRPGTTCAARSHRCPPICSRRATRGLRPRGTTWGNPLSG